MIASTADRVLCSNLDSDSALEIAWCDSAARVVHLFDNDAGIFVAARAFAAGTEGPISVAGVDLTGDGILDLATSNDASSAFSILVGLGDLRFDAVEHIRRPDSNFFPMLADFTGDGLVDLASYATFDVPTTLNRCWRRRRHLRSGRHCVAPVARADPAPRRERRRTLRRPRRRQQRQPLLQDQQRRRHLRPRHLLRPDRGRRQLPDRGHQRRWPPRRALVVGADLERSAPPAHLARRRRRPLRAVRRVPHSSVPQRSLDR